MNIVQCMYCKKPFASLGGRICPACNEKIDKDFITVRDYIYEHKSSNIDIIAEETEVSKHIIIHLLKEGRLVIDGPGGGAGVLFCEMCKKPINTGRLCKDCTGNVASKMDKNIAGHRQHSSGGSDFNFKSSAKIKK